MNKVINKYKLNMKEREKIRQFADAVTPSNWNVWIDSADFKSGREILNICLRIVSRDKWIECEAQLNIHGATPAYIDVMDDTYFTIIMLSEYWTVKRGYKEVIIHELAHVAVLRWITCKKKMCKQLPYLVNSIYKRDHGTKAFKNATRALTKRARELELL